MTRAAERLVVCGARGDRKIPDGCWYQLVEDALKADCVIEPADDGEGEVLRYRKGAAEPATADKARSRTNPCSNPRCPRGSRTTRRRTSQGGARITPSGPLDDDARPVAAGGGADALLRGSLVHRLMQSLPDIPAASRRRQAAADYPRPRRRRRCRPTSATNSPSKSCASSRMRASRKLSAPAAGPKCRSSASSSSRANPFRVSGQIDRLAVTQASVLIADFKSNRPAPRRIEDVPPSYVRQLALYRAVAREIIPGQARARRADLDRST